MPRCRNQHPLPSRTSQQQRQGRLTWPGRVREARRTPKTYGKSIGATGRFFWGSRAPVGNRPRVATIGNVP
jgi:hypothetical protein